MKNPSKPENIAEYFCTEMTGGLTANTPCSGSHILEVKVWETEIQSATYRP